MIGEFVVRQGVLQLEKRVQRRSPSSPTENSSSAVAPTVTQDPEPQAVDNDIAPEPFADYDTYTSRQVLERVSTMTVGEQRRVWEYENENRRRETILAALAPVAASATSHE